MADIEGLKGYLRCADEDELEMYLEGAKAYAINAGVPPMEGSGLYDLLVYRIAAYEYDNRGGQSSREDFDAFMRSVNMFVLSLRYGGGGDG